MSTIVLAVSLRPSEACPLVQEALCGPGAPVGLVSCVPDGTDRLRIEFAPDVTPIELFLRIIDVELHRFGGSRTVEPIGELPIDVLAAIAARGLMTPDLTAGRVLETYMDAP